jgi:hypothetical protein
MNSQRLKVSTCGVSEFMRMIKVYVRTFDENVGFAKSPALSNDAHNCEILAEHSAAPGTAYFAGTCAKKLHIAIIPYKRRIRVIHNV